jgi:hypothetical protein
MIRDQLIELMAPSLYFFLKSKSANKCFTIDWQSSNDPPKVRVSYGEGELKWREREEERRAREKAAR